MGSIDRARRVSGFCLKAHVCLTPDFATFRKAIQLVSWKLGQGAAADIVEYYSLRRWFLQALRARSEEESACRTFQLATAAPRESKRPTLA
jgi:hypothetical protein